MPQTPEDTTPVTPTSAKNSAQPPASRAKAARERATSSEPRASRTAQSSSAAKTATPAATVAAKVPPAFGGPQARPQAALSGGNTPARRLVLPIMAALVVGAVLGGASGAGIAVLITQDSTEQTAAVNPQQGVVINNASAVTDISAVAAKASPSVVTIKVSTATSGGSGSGVIISNDGYIVTNAHVVTLSGATNEATWQVEDSRGLLYNAKLVGTDPTVDLAVLKVDGVTDWTPIEWADSGKLNVGDVTIAMGAPLGLAGTVTTGIISALNRSILIGNSAVPDQSDSTTPDQDNPFDFFQFDYGQGQGQTQASIT
ncbi:MAG: S1C family serine protease, partial [Aurantimicrobium sp.]|nr:S1C family serine protease [Aurantimicrobium sp.]